MYKQYVYKQGHPLSNSLGKVRKSRFVLYKKLGGRAGRCNWCGVKLTWKTLCADHLDSNIMNDVEENLVPSCRGCNANRDDGTGHGRIKPRPCAYCKKEFKPTLNARLFCSLTCSARAKPKREKLAPHGTRAKYNYGCRCQLCGEARRIAYKAWYEKNKLKTK